MYCKKCGTKNKDDARFCANCGEKLVIPPQQQAKQQPAQPKQQIYTEPQNEPKRSSKSWIIALACVIVVVVGIFGFQYLKSEDKKEATATTENKTSAKTTEKKATENNAGEDVADAKDSTEKSQVLSYTDNEDMDLSACTDSDDYQYVSSEDNSFEFAYPKYLFNRSYVNKTGNQYTLEYANSDKADDYEIKAVISSQKAGSGNAVKSVQKLYKQKKKSIKNVTYAYPQGGKTPKLYQGKSSMIVMGYLDSDKTKCEYVLLTSDGKKDYMMQINFFDSDYKDEYKEMTFTNNQRIMEMTEQYASKAGMFPYYLYRQKNMKGNFENVGYAKPEKEGIYNILIMEEKQSILALGAGASTKFVMNDRIERAENVKDIKNYIERIDEMIERKKQGYCDYEKNRV